jgi:hypothetical protein
MGMFSAFASFASVANPKVNRLWCRVACSTKLDLSAEFPFGKYAMKTASSTDLKFVMFFESRKETAGSADRLMKATILE